METNTKILLVSSGEKAAIEREAARIRRRLASAWDRGQPMTTIRRLEQALRERWRRLDELHVVSKRPLPA